MTKSFRYSVAANKRLQDLIPGGAHTYAKGEDQYPADMAPVIDHGDGAHVWDVDGNEYIEYGSGLRAVSLGHAHPKVVEAVRREVERGTTSSGRASSSWRRPNASSTSVPTAEMVKFAKNGSDVTTAAVKLARAVTGRAAGRALRRPAVLLDRRLVHRADADVGRRPRGDRRSDRRLPVRRPGRTWTAAHAHEGEIACLILEAATSRIRRPAPPGLRRICADRYGALLVLDEMITGFRWHLRRRPGLLRRRRRTCPRSARRWATGSRCPRSRVVAN